MQNHFYDISDELHIKILLFVSEALVIQRRNNALVIQRRKEFMDIRNDLWSYSGRIAFVAVKESDAPQQAE